MNQEPNCNFIFEVFLTRLKTNQIQIKNPQNLKVTVRFNDLPVHITQSRINVTDFKPESSIEFNVSAKKLRDNIEKCGMPVSVMYNNITIGTTVVSFPKSFIESINHDMSDLMHSEYCKFTKAGEEVGTLEFLFRLYLKCDENTRNEDRECRTNMDQCISPQDIMFIMGENQACPDPCGLCPDVLMSEEDDERLELDLERYRSSKPVRRRTADHLINNPNATCVMKNMARECEQIVDSIFKSTAQTQLFKPLKKSHCVHNVDPLLETPLGRETFPCFSYLPEQQSKIVDLCNPKQMPVPISDLEKPLIRPTRFCPVCLTNMSWLPKFAACPNCGVKPTPVIEERHKEKKLTADQILNDYFGKQPESFDDYSGDRCAKTAKGKSEDQQAGCRCTCNGGKVCAHCRIRELCLDIFQGNEQVVGCPKVKPQSSEDFCVINTNLRECRPHLARVFSELQDLYNIRKSALASNQDKHCQNTESHKDKSQQPDDNTLARSLSTRREKNIKKNTTRKSLKTTGEQALSSIRARHKSCLSQQGTVSRRHGWNWTCTHEARMYGWRPGFIRKPIQKLMKFFLHYLPMKNELNISTKIEEAEKQKERQLPILNVCKKNGEIFVTLRAVNNSNVEMQPIKFKIVKSDLAIALRAIKRKLIDNGFPKCTCHKTVMMCICRNYMEKKHLEYALHKECKHRGMEDCVNDLVFTDTSDSEMEFDFDVTPPMDVAKPRPIAVDRATQTHKKDLDVPPTYPIKHSPFWGTYDCAAGDRYTSTAFGAPGEEVFEDGVFGNRGGGPHAAYATPRDRPKNKNIWGATSGRPMYGAGLFPYGNPKSPNGKTEPIPVRMTGHLLRMAENVVKAKQVVQKSNTMDMMKYLKKHGAFSNPMIGPDGLTDSKRRRRALRLVPRTPIEFVTRLGKDCNPCADQCCNPCTTGFYYC
ncbi:uncharacterized protein LOC116805804 [Drosophila grimshawi]|uniref:uncharacterized protein LOC116805804 n=1 Tax=Drosophila grimshawi TaxID=7222 RepID=UPI000C870C50|nr:uncharacterized protein LOC116805804 [Drosophila grimshawi]